jgi:hypothetical protein
MTCNSHSFQLQLDRCASVSADSGARLDLRVNAPTSVPARLLSQTCLMKGESVKTQKLLIVGVQQSIVTNCLVTQVPAASTPLPQTRCPAGCRARNPKTATSPPKQTANMAQEQTGRSIVHAGEHGGGAKAGDGTGPTQVRLTPSDPNDLHPRKPQVTSSAGMPGHSGASIGGREGQWLGQRGGRLLHVS